MSSKLHWQFNGLEGVFQVRTGELNLVLSPSDGLDRIARPTPGADGFKITEEEGGKLLLEALGEVRLLVGNSRLGRAKLASGGSIKFELDSAVGMLSAEIGNSSNDPNIGKEVGGYKILGVLGSGAVGVVYRALQSTLDRTVALKVLNSRAAQDPLAVTSFKREAVSAGRLSHPNLVQVYDVGAANGLHYYSMELVSGGTLEDQLREQGPMPWRKSLEAVRDCALALAYAQQHNLVHRDVKPDNLMFADSGHVKLADLGLSATRGMLDQETIGGTPHFMAPECARGDDFDHRADMYSLGCTMFRLLTGDTVFSGNNVREILRHQVESEPPSLADHGLKVPVGVEHLLSSLLAKDPDERPDSGTEVALECELLLEKRKSNKFALIGITGMLGVVAYLAITERDKEPVDPTIVEVVRNDPAAVAREAELQIRLDFANAKGQPEIDLKRVALEEFIAKHPDSSLATEAATLLRLLPTKVEEGIADPAALAVTILEAELVAAFDGFRYVELLEQLAADHPHLRQEDRRRLQAIMLESVSGVVAGWEAEHAQSLLEDDWVRAVELEKQIGSLAAASPSKLTSRQWRQVGERLALDLAAAQYLARERILRTARVELLVGIQTSIADPIRQLDFVSASEALEGILDRCTDERLVAMARPIIGMCELASSAVASLQSQLASGDGLFIVDPLDGKHARVVALGPAGVEIETQQHGKKVRRVESWERMTRPEVLAGLLEASSARPAAATACYLLVGSHRVGAALRILGTAAPGPSTLDQLRVQAESFAWQFPNGVAPTDPALLNEKAALEAAAGVCRELVRGDDFGALLWLEQLSARFSLLAAIASDGSSEFGIKP